MEQMTCKVDSQGRVTLPVEWRKAHSIESGGEVSIGLDDNHLTIQTIDQSLDEACRIAAKYRKGKPALELLQEERQQQNKREKSLEESYGQGLR
jgi:bifunctional DNA-binding transcriptional regulator/antitoxin component of YhaV-PrlF toxin-antitoxin module